MKRIITICAAFIITANVLAQSPEKMSYQAVIRDASNALVATQAVGIQLSILQGGATGTPVYVETQTPTTNVNGLVSLEIGTGTIVSGDFTSINWANNSYFIKTETDPTGGSNYTITGTSQLMSVPYALYAKTAGNVKKYSVGDFAQGGIVFWVDETGQHGLVSAKKDQSIGANVKWGNDVGTFGYTMAEGDGVYSGEMNTILIMAKEGINDGSPYAAKICSSYSVTESGITYGDWYLPSKEELNLMRQNKTIINTTAVSNGGNNLSSFYWSSTEFSNEKAWYQVFSGTDTTQSTDDIIIPYPVRAIRAF